MNLAALSLEDAPAFWTPVRFFLTVPVFGIIAAAILLVDGGQLLQSRWQGATLAMVHALALGYIAMGMLGALLQMLPVVMGAVFPWADRAAVLLHVLLFAGTLCLVGAFVTQLQALFVSAIVLLVPALLLFGVGVLVALARTGQGGSTARAAQLAALALIVTVAIGAWLASGHAFATVPVKRVLTDTHAAWGMVGWILVLVIGVSAQVIPMFLATAPYPARFNSRLVYLLIALLCAGSLLPSPTVRVITVILVNSLMVVYALVTLYLLGKRRRKRTDISDWFWRTGMLCLILTAAVMVYAYFTGGEPEAELMLLSGVLLLAGFAPSVINGMLYKIVPFLVWLNLRMPVLKRQIPAGTRLYTPNIHEVINARWMKAQFMLHLAALLLLPGVVVVDSRLGYAAATLLLLSNSLLLVNLLHAVKVYRTHVGQPAGLKQ